MRPYAAAGAADPRPRSDCSWRPSSSRPLWKARGDKGLLIATQNISAGTCQGLLLARRSLRRQLMGAPTLGRRRVALPGRRVWKGMGGAELPPEPLPSCRLKGMAQQIAACR